MSLELYLGVPGSGKSYHTAKRVYEALRAGKNVISSLNINTNLIKPISDKKPLGNFIYVPDRFWFNNAVYEKTSLGGKVQSKEVYSYIYGLYNFALQFHKRNARGQMIEGQTLLILDEAYKFLILVSGIVKIVNNGLNSLQYFVIMVMMFFSFLRLIFLLINRSVALLRLVFYIVELLSISFLVRS